MGALVLTGADKVSGSLAYIGEILLDKPAFLMRAGTIALAAAQMRIRSGIPPSTAETSKGSTLYRDGALFRSLSIGGEGNVYELTGDGITVGTALRTPDGRFNIGQLMQGGTGPIFPKKGKVLVFELNGVTVFAKSTRGIPARPFLYFDDETVARILGALHDTLFALPGGA